MQPKRRVKLSRDPELLLVRTVRATDTQWAAIKRVTWARLRSLAMEMDAQMQREAKREARNAAANGGSVSSGSTGASDSGGPFPAPARTQDPAPLAEAPRSDADLLAAAKERFRKAQGQGP